MKHLNATRAACVICIAILFASVARSQTIEEAIHAKTDVWGEAALNRPEGPTYDYFANLLPPLRYVEAPFRVYPIVLSAPGAAKKARLLSDGSAINALARQPNWVGEGGTPVTFRVGKEREAFGADLHRLIGPKLSEGWLPIVQMHYRHGDQVYSEECFADVDPALTERGVAHMRFSLVQGTSGKVEAQIEGTAMLALDGKSLRNVDKKVVACFGDKWEFNRARNSLVAWLKPGEGAVLTIYTVPGDQAIDASTYRQRIDACAQKWEALIGSGMTINVPETVVNNAWRAALIGSYELLTGDDIRYSQGNAYAKLYIGEGGDATRSFALYGHGDDAAKMMTPLFVYTRKNLEFHQAAFKLQMMCHLYRLSRDRTWMNEHRELWQKELNVILNGRETSTGLLPREKYCGDIDTMVNSLNSNSNCWRALRDMSYVLGDLGDTEQSQKLAAIAADYRKAILGALDNAIQRDVSPPFVPIALSGEEKPYDLIPAQRMGGYWNIMINYVLGSGVFPASSQTATDVLHYLQQHGGLMMGMLKTHEEMKWFYQGDEKINDLYGMRYALTLLQRDEADRALVSFYGKLAQGFARDTFICCEGSDIVPLDEFGRIMYLPPNSAGNANFLEQLRYTLVQDWDLDDDGAPDTLRLAFATPRAWLKDGGRISVQRAPTAFGEVSFVIESALAKGTIHADVTLPDRTPPKTVFLRLRLPVGHTLKSASINGRDVNLIDGQTIDLSGMTGKVSIEAKASQ